MDRLLEMEAFATVVDQGGFTDAAKKLGLSKSAISKHVSSLEARLGARLLNRTTRPVSPTEIGLAYYDRACRVLSDAGEADALVTSMQATPSGQLRVAVDADFGANHLSPLVGDFLAKYPDISVNMEFGNRYLELISEGFDAAVRVGELQDSSLRARKLTETTIRRVALPNPKCAPSLIFLWVPFPAKGQMSGDDLSNILNAGVKSSALWRFIEALSRSPLQRVCLIRALFPYCLKQ